MTAALRLSDVHSGADHCDISVPNIFSAHDNYRKLGFATIPPSLYTGMPMATCQIIFPGFYVAVTGLTEDPATAIKKIPGPFQERAKHHGISYISLGSDDAAKCAATFRDAGLIASEPFEGKRVAEINGEKKEIGFSLAMLPLPIVPDTSIDFITQHLTPDLIWSKARSPHPNGAERTKTLLAVHPQPQMLADAFRRIFGAGSVTVTAGGIDVDARTMTIAVLVPAAFQERTGGLSPAPYHGTRRCQFAGLEFAVGNLAATTQFFASAGIAVTQSNARLSIDARQAENVVLTFVGG